MTNAGQKGYKEVSRLILWTLQTERAYKRLQECGVLRTDGRRVIRELREPYCWMAEQMRKRICPPPPGVTFPVWAWYRWKGVAKPKPDLRYLGHENPRRGRIGYRIEFEIQDALVLLSNTDMWFEVFHHQYVARGVRDELRFWEEIIEAGFGTRFDKLNLPEPFHSQVRDSREHIFDLRFGTRSLYGPYRARPIQATVWEVHRDMVLDITRFIGK